MNQVAENYIPSKNIALRNSFWQELKVNGNCEGYQREAAAAVRAFLQVLDRQDIMNNINSVMNEIKSN